MITAELYAAGRPIVIVERDAAASRGAWARLEEAYSRGVVGGTASRIEISADVFFAELDVLRDVRNLYGEPITFGLQAVTQLKRLARDRRDREAAIAEASPNIVPDFVSELDKIGFRRSLKSFQIRNLERLWRLPHGADFSVPGSGKTTVALANFALRRHKGEISRLLVVGPLAAFPAWKDDAAACLETMPVINVHVGPGSLIPENTEILLTTYGRLASDYDRIRRYVAESPTQVILDEAHRVKRGGSGVHGRAVLDLAYAAARRDVLTGTPSPQGAHDLIALIGFLYPGQDREILPPSAYVEKNGRDADVLQETSVAVKRYFARTTKRELDLPPTKFVVRREPMGPIQAAIYDALVGRYKSAFALDTADRRSLDRIGKITMYLLEAATNPMLLVAGSDSDDEPAFRHPPLEVQEDRRLVDLLQKYGLYETPWKYEVIAEIVEEGRQRGEKIIVWSNFVRNLELLAKRLTAYRPAIIHGGIPSEDAAGANGGLTRESELHRFKNSPDCSVLLANPAACGEGISLHHWCHHAVYLDRTFNAGHFLQSQDRIHRLGLAAGAITEFTVLLSAASIDDSVDGRLVHKVRALSKLMDDPDLVRVALPGDRESEDNDAPPVALDDFEAVVEHLAQHERSAT